MIEKLKPLEGLDHSWLNKINEICDVVNKQQKQIDKVSCAILDLTNPDGENKALKSIKAEPDFITTSYMTDGHTQEYYGQNGARVQFDCPIPAGYTITITDPAPAENTIISKMEKIEPANQYAEQSKWIGKLCRCWDSDINDDIWGILQGIKDNKTEKYYLYGIGYEHCEPVKPDDDIIYKGGDNE